MHPRNRFSHCKPDFNLYAITRPSLKQYLKPTQGTQCTLDFNNHEALRELTCACLEHEFNLKVDIPLGHLVPTIPLRLNYIHWIEDLLNLLSKSPDNEIVGVDIGCGPVCVYPLLGSCLNGWSFVATEIQEECVKFARENVLKNKLNDKVTVIQVTNDIILKGAIDQPPHDTTQYSFCMCNPPFYADQSELSEGSNKRTHTKGLKPVPGNTGNEYETITEGGEVTFVKRIITDSLTMKNKIKWYTSMVGKKDSLTKIKSFLKELKVEVVMDTTFVQGKTHRWGVAWSFDSTLKDLNSKKVGSNKRPHPHSITVPSNGTINNYSKALEWIKETFTKLKIHYNEVSPGTLVCNTTVNTWSKQRKRKRLMKRIEETKQSSSGIQHREKDAKSSQVIQYLQTELQSLDTPCIMEFTCCVMQEEIMSCEEETQDQETKKRKMTPKDKKDCLDEKETIRKLLYSLEWSSGEGSRDELHQIVQLIQNLLLT